MGGFSRSDRVDYCIDYSRNELLGFCCLDSVTSETGGVSRWYSRVSGW